MTDEQKKKSMKLLIDSEQNLIKSKISKLEVEAFEGLDLSNVKNTMSSLIGDIDNLQELKDEYEKKYVKIGFCADDIPF